MLTPEQREVLMALIRPQLGVNPSLAVVAIFVGDEIAENMPTFTHLKHLSQWMLDQAMRQAAPDILIRMVRAADNGDGRLGSIIDLADELSADAERWVRWARAQGFDGSMDGDPLHVEDGRPFIDRESFRQLIPREDAPPSPPCILVEGDIGSGKTYLYEYCKRLASHRRNFRVGCTTVGSSGARNFDPETAAFDLAIGLDTDLRRMPRAHEDPHRYARNLVAWITESTPAQNLPSMAIFDGFDAPGISDPTRTFVEELIRSVQEDEEVRARLRVLLLGYDVSRLEQQNLEFARCVLEFVDASHIEEWLRKRFPDQPDYRYEDTVSMIDQRLPSSGDMRLQRLCHLVHFAAARFQETV